MTPEVDKAVPELLKAFNFRDKEAQDLYKAVLTVLDLALQIEMGKVMNANTLGEQRTHAAGRLDAINDVLVEFQKLRSEAEAKRTGGG